MGINLINRRSECRWGAKIVPTGNPRPSNFEILRVEKVGSFLLAEIRYPDALNYEGVKILVFENTSEELLRAQKEIDPHFCDKRHLSPVARFEPTEKGWKLAKRVCLGYTVK